MRFLCPRVALAAVAAVALWSGVSRQTAGAEPGPAAAEFDRVFHEWQALLTDLRKLKDEYKTARSGRQSEIKPQFDELSEKAVAMQAELIRAAAAAYREAPGASKDVSDFLREVVPFLVYSDDYETALPAAESLAESDEAGAPMYAFAGVAALATMELEKAQKYLDLAKEKDVLGVLSGLGEEHHLGMMTAAAYPPLLPYYRENWPKEQAIRRAEAKADDLPRVLLKTNRGDLVVELFENEAPNTVANFVSLVEEGFYDGLVFHRVLPGFMAQGGCPEGTGTGGPGYHIPCECEAENHRLHFRGSLSMAHAGRDTGGSQFFITFAPTPHLDGKHTVFGRVVEGMDVLAKIQRRDPEGPRQTPPDKILEAKVLRKRPHEYVPQKVGE